MAHINLSNQEELERWTGVIRSWIEQKTGRKIEGEIRVGLADGSALCALMNALRPGAIRKYTENPKISAVKLENMTQFLRSLQTKFGFSTLQLLQASDLCSGQCDIKRLIGLLIAVKLKTEDNTTPSVSQNSASPIFTTSTPQSQPSQSNQTSQPNTQPQLKVEENLPPSLSTKIEDLISSFKNRTSCEIITPENKKYDFARAIFNQSHNNLPHFILRPRNTKDVCQIIKIIKPTGFSISLKAQGHCFSGTAVVDDTILVDMHKYE
eukprot:TRINITY_DN5094_c0_g1_i4.p1 TRINITY_DN5094_c0_g1~~TRINITY_DN5094_c0_g1_i4.p1  ORF type:complete len:266 (+),score=40.92 TRINITY_DN5094_c0_g1_i4:651-1448(+)